MFAPAAIVIVPLLEIVELEPVVAANVILLNGKSFVIVIVSVAEVAVVDVIAVVPT